MSDRVIRQEVWFSESFESLSSDAFRLFVALTNAADDYGLLEVSYGAIKRAAPLRTWSAEGVAKLLGELAAAGLILPYEVDSKCLAAISLAEPGQFGETKTPDPTMGPIPLPQAHRVQVEQGQGGGIRLARAG
jgi:hypothetical protein